MKSLTVRLPEALVAEIEHESRSRHVSKSDGIRERLTRLRTQSVKPRTMREMIGNLIGSVSGLPADLSSNKKNTCPA
ncbi:MAG TPA: CopG family transcriptional regulator [Verrucomicrobiae bacterium]|nr:CopG family transcriptional regulator [Verrucomicrobiae bacterium]